MGLSRCGFSSGVMSMLGYLTQLTCSNPNRPPQIYDMRLQQYANWLVEEIHPSMDTVLSPKRRHVQTGSDMVTSQLDQLNHRYTALLDLLYDRLKQIAGRYPQDSTLQVITKHF